MGNLQLMRIILIWLDIHHPTDLHTDLNCPGGVICGINSLISRPLYVKGDFELNNQPILVSHF
jgi:hypothetical protein